MISELDELMDTAISKEIASQAFYIAGQQKTEDPGARELMRYLAEEEKGHAERLQQLKDQGWNGKNWQPQYIPNLMISEYLLDTNIEGGTGLQDTLIYAMKREQHAAEFYIRMTKVVADESARKLCEKLAYEELNHKLKLETLYEEVFYGEN